MNNFKKSIFIIVFFYSANFLIFAQERIGESYSSILNSLNISGQTVNKSTVNGLKTLSYGGTGKDGSVVTIKYNFNKLDICTLMVFSTNSSELTNQIISTFNYNGKKIQPENGFTKSWRDPYGIICSYKEIEVKGVRYYNIYYHK